jgi:ribosomal protein S17E
MGKTKSKLIRRTVNILLKRGIEFSEEFKKNKKILGNNTMPGKKIRNQTAGLISRTKKQERKLEEKKRLTLGK